MSWIRTASWLVGAALLLAGSGPAWAESAVIIQESNGFPGGEKTTELSRQKISIRDGQLRVLDPAHLWTLFISLPERTVREGSAAAGEYEERAFDYYHRYRADREKNLRAQAEQYLRQRQRTDDDKARRQLDDEYRRMGGNPDDPGKLVARLQHYPQDRRTAKVLVDREEREVTLEHYVIRENQKDRPAFDLWVTKDVDLPVDLLKFYRALGPFGPEVEAKLAEVPGTLVECQATLDTGTFHRTYRSRVVEFRTQEEVPPADVTVPASWKEVEPGEAEPTPEIDAVTCVVDGEQVPREDALTFRDPRTGRLYYVCDSSERAELIRMLARGERPPHAGRGGR